MKPLTFVTSASSIPQETRMGTMRLALAWEARISSAQPFTVMRDRTPRDKEVRVTPSEFMQGAAAAAAESPTDEAALATACQAGDLRAFERLYRLHGSKMKSVARNLLGTTADAEDAVQDTFL